MAGRQLEESFATTPQSKCPGAIYGSEGPHQTWSVLASFVRYRYTQVQGTHKPAGQQYPAVHAAQISEYQLEAADVNSASNFGSIVATNSGAVPQLSRARFDARLVLA